MRSESFLIAAIVSVLTLAISPAVAAQHTQYRVVNLGTGFVNVEWGANGAPALTANGTITGAVTTPTLTTATNNPLICGPTSTGNFPFVLHTFEERRGVFQDLGSLPPEESNCSIPTQVNESGEIVGMTEIDELDPLRGYKQVRAVIWKNGQIIDLGALDGKEREAGTINSHGQIAGNYLNLVPDLYSFIDLLIFGSSNGTQARGFFWQNGTAQDIGTLGGADTAVTFMNDSGQVMGFSYTNATVNSTTGIPTIDPFIWQDGTMTDLGTLGGTVGMP